MIAPNAPQKIASATWLAVEKAVVAGLGYSEAARRFGIRSPHSVIMRARRYKWPVLSRVGERANALQRSVTERALACDKVRADNERTTEALAESWAEKGESHRGLAFEVAHKAVKAALLAPPAVAGWADLERADKMARRAAGLDNDEAAKVANTFNFAMLGDRADEIIEVGTLSVPQ